MRTPKFIQKALSSVLMSVTSSWTWPWLIRESFTGAWQQNVVETDSSDQLLRFSAVYACVTGISTDVAKMRIKLSRDEAGIWREITGGSPFLPVLRKPNHYQTRIKFIEQWIVSKLLNGNTYVLKQRDARDIVRALYVLDPQRVTPLVSESGEVFYQLRTDFLNQVDKDKVDSVDEGRIVIPARELIHDMMVSLWHPLIGVSPLYACALAATMGNRIMNSSTGFFTNRAIPGGVLTAPGSISDATAARLKSSFEENFSGVNAGRLAVLGDGLKFETMQMTAEAAQLAEQLKFTIEDIARAFHYPLFKLGGPLPPYAGNVEALIVSYYTDCLQILIESLELSLDEGLGLPSGMGVELDLDGLLRMDTAAMYESNNQAVGGGWMAPNEARSRANLVAVEGGESPYLQQQNYSLAALAKRDAQDDPFKSNSPPAAPVPSPDEPEDEEEERGYGVGVKEWITA